MEKCDICGSEIKELLLGKLKGTFIKGKGKLYKVCNNCQKEYTQSELKQKLKV
ncbi:Uncharacterised protein [Candidatus Tiddalikarchaeum anstoanum]|nr:Uncharacterised protein [Candidatus Tiddalikarchaeum anstoanum]